MKELFDWLRAQLDVEEAGADADAFPPPGYSTKSDPGRARRGMRILAEVDAKRRILDEIAPDDCRSPDCHGLAEQVARLLALPYAEQPGYRQEWRP